MNSILQTFRSFIFFNIRILAIELIESLLVKICLSSSSSSSSPSPRLLRFNKFYIISTSSEVSSTTVLYSTNVIPSFPAKLEKDVRTLPLASSIMTLKIFLSTLFSRILMQLVLLYYDCLR